MLLFERGDYFFSFDLKSGYHHVDIAPPHCKYLGFAWEGHFYVFTVLPFGLSSACYMFTKLLRPLVRYWRAKGLRILVYLDDGLCAVAGRQKALEASELVRTTLARPGFVVHLIKSIWEPIRRAAVAWVCGRFGTRADRGSPSKVDRSPAYARPRMSGGPDTR